MRPEPDLNPLIVLIRVESIRKKEEEMQTTDIPVRRISFVSSKTFNETLRILTATIGQPDTSAFQKAIEEASTLSELQEIVSGAIGSSGLIEFARFDPGGILRAEHGGQGPKIIRLLVGNPLIMTKMTKDVPDTASYAPVTILIDERADGMHLSFDSMASLLAPYGSEAANIVAKGVDTYIQGLLIAAAGV
jgi:uncharacterized protein (DUF302 family)